MEYLDKLFGLNEELDRGILYCRISSLSASNTSGGIYTIGQMFRSLGLVIKVAKQGISIPYLMFADDCLIFYKSNKTAARNIRDILQDYCKVSGQLVNLHKSTVQFSKGVQKDVKHSITDILQIPISSSIGKYLGCHNIDNKRTKGDFACINEKINRKLVGWKARMLSHAGKTILVKSNLTGIPMLAMQEIKSRGTLLWK